MSPTASMYESKRRSNIRLADAAAPMAQSGSPSPGLTVRRLTAGIEPGAARRRIGRSRTAPGGTVILCRS